MRCVGGGSERPPSFRMMHASDRATADKRRRLFLSVPNNIVSVVVRFALVCPPSSIQPLPIIIVMSDYIVPVPFRRPVADPQPNWGALTSVANKAPGFKTNHKVAIDRMCEMRRRIVETVTVPKMPTAAAQESFISAVLLPYGHHLVHAQRHLPLAGGSAPDAAGGASGAAAAPAEGSSGPVSFCWRGAWDGGSSKSTLQTSTSGGLELASVVWDVAAAYSWMGSMEVIKMTPDAIKAAFRYFQCAAGAFGSLGGDAAGTSDGAAAAVVRLNRGDSVGDFDGSMIAFCYKLCLAHAHHCGFLKAEAEMRDKRVLLSKLAADGAALYETACNVIVNASAWGLAGQPAAAFTDLIRCARAAGKVLRARGHVFLAEELASVDKKGNIGLAIAHLNKALKCLPHESVRDTIDSWVTAVNNSAVELHNTLSSRNGMVYFDPVPGSVDELVAPGRPLGKAIPPFSSLAQMDPAATEADPFTGLVPQHAVAFAAKFRERLSDELTAVTMATLGSRSKGSDAIGAMGVRAVIDSVLSPNRSKPMLPSSTRARIVTFKEECAASNRGAPGPMRTNSAAIVDCIVGAMAQAGEVGQSGGATLQSVVSELDREKVADESWANEYGEKFWRSRRQPSHLLPDVVALRRSIGDIEMATQRLVMQPIADVRHQLEAKATAISRLDWPIEDLDALMPTPVSHEAVALSADLAQSANALQKLVERFDQVEVVEASQLKELQNALLSDNILAALSTAEMEHRDEVLQRLEAEVKDRFSVLSSAAASRESLLNEMEQVMTHIATLRSNDPVAKEAQTVCGEIEAALSVAQSSLTRCHDICSAASGLLQQAESALSLARSVAEARLLEGKEYAEQLEREIAARSASTKSREASLQRQQEILAEIQSIEQRRQGVASMQQPTTVAAAQATPFGAQPVNSTTYQPPAHIFGGPPGQPPVAPGSYQHAAPVNSSPPPPGNPAFMPTQRYGQPPQVAYGHPQPQPYQPYVPAPSSNGQPYHNGPGVPQPPLYYSQVPPPLVPGYGPPPGYTPQGPSPGHR